MGQIPQKLLPPSLNWQIHFVESIQSTRILCPGAILGCCLEGKLKGLILISSNFSTFVQFQDILVIPTRKAILGSY